MTSNILYVRLRPFDRRHGRTAKTYTYKGLVFREGPRNWYKVSEEIGKYLDTLHYNDDPDGPKKFDVCTLKEAEALIIAEKAARERAAAKRDENVLTSRDMTADIEAEKERERLRKEAEAKRAEAAANKAAAKAAEKAAATTTEVK